MIHRIRFLGLVSYVKGLNGLFCFASSLVNLIPDFVHILFLDSYTLVQYLQVSMPVMMFAIFFGSRVKASICSTFEGYQS